MKSQKHIAIITFARSVNYGAVLQATALVYILRSVGSNVEVIDYRGSHLGLYSRGIHKRILSALWSKIRLLFGYRKRLIRTREFIESNDLISERVYNSGADFIEADDLYDLFIVGSDQVWNPDIIGRDDTYFLSFVRDKRKRASYAASFGINELPSDSWEYYRDRLDGFQWLSVRENRAKTIISELGVDSNVDVVLDPTLLLTAGEWQKFARGRVRISDSYILCYFMPGEKRVTSMVATLAKQIADSLGVEIVNIGKKEYSVLNVFSNNVVDAGPGEFLSLVRDARGIVTNSFHGTAFSVIFGKPFYSVVGSLSAGEGALSGRITDLIDMFGLRENLVTLDQNMACKRGFPDIDYTRVSKVCALRREESLVYIKSLIEGHPTASRK